MFLNILNGPYLTTHQVDRVLKVSASETDAIERSHLLFADENGEWRIADTAQAGSTTAPGALLYLALQPSSDHAAIMAGGYPVGNDLTPKIGGLSLATHMNIQTDMFDGEIELEDALTVEDGKFVRHTAGKTVYGFCTKAPFQRIANAGVIVGPLHNGSGNITVVEIATVYAPQVSDSAS